MLDNIKISFSVIKAKSNIAEHEKVIYSEKKGLFQT